MNEMRLHDPEAFAGRVEIRTIESSLLKGNPLGDPHRRDVPVYVPPGEARDLPVVFVLTGYTGRGQSLLESHPWKASVALQYDRLVATDKAPPVLLVFPDCFTRLGGSQYVNSSAVGLYEDHVVEDLVPFVDAHWSTQSGGRGVCGKSSGGFGALHLGMHHPDTFHAVASISGDCAFEHGYAHDFLPACRGLLEHGGDPQAFLTKFETDHKLKGDGHAVISLLAMAACYSPNPIAPLGFDLPVNLETGERIKDVWDRWLRFDPVVAAAAHVDALKSLKLLHLEAGKRDEFHLQFGLRILVRKLKELGVPHVHEEFEGGHFDINHRYLGVIPKLVEALRG